MVLVFWQKILVFNKISCNANIQLDTAIIVVVWANALSLNDLFSATIIWTPVITSVSFPLSLYFILAMWQAMAVSEIPILKWLNSHPHFQIGTAKKELLCKMMQSITAAPSGSGSVFPFSLTSRCCNFSLYLLFFQLMTPLLTGRHSFWAGLCWCL